MKPLIFSYLIGYMACHEWKVRETKLKPLMSQSIGSNYEFSHNCDGKMASLGWCDLDPKGTMHWVVSFSSKGTHDVIVVVDHD